MSDPLVPPLAAVVSGILLGRALTFSRFEAAWPVAVFLVLALVASRRLRRWCLLLALIFVGAFTEAWHRPGPRPTIDAGRARQSCWRAAWWSRRCFRRGASSSRWNWTRDARAAGEFAARRRRGAAAPGIRAAASKSRRACGRRAILTILGRSIMPDIWRGRRFIGRRAWRADRTARYCRGAAGCVRWRSIFALRGAALDRIERLV